MYRYFKSVLIDCIFLYIFLHIKTVIFVSSFTPRNVQLLLVLLILSFWNLMWTILFVSFLTRTFFAIRGFCLVLFFFFALLFNLCFLYFLFLNCKYIKSLIWQNYLSAQYLQLFKECYLMLSHDNLTKIQSQSLSKDLTERVNVGILVYITDSLTVRRSPYQCVLKA